MTTDVHSVMPSGTASSPPLTVLAPGAFLRRLVEGNGWAEISHFLFPPGSLFEDPHLWWASGGQPSPAHRPHPHEGIDLCWMEEKAGCTIPLPPGTRIPTLLPGVLLHFHRDFLGETLYIQHPGMRRGKACFYTIFGHMRPGNSSEEVPFSSNQWLGTINACAAGGKAPAHLHISCGWIADDFPRTALCWEALATSEAVQLIDPYPLLLAAPETWMPPEAD